MELWIRSQDRKYLIKTEYLYVVYCKTKKCAYIGDKIAGHIARYKSEKRALEVLDEIQNLLQPKIFVSEPKIEYDKDNLIENLTNNVIFKTTQQLEYDLKDAGQIVYEIPKE